MKYTRLDLDNAESTAQTHQPRGELLPPLLLYILAGGLLNILPFLSLKLVLVCAGWILLRFSNSPTFAQALKRFFTRDFWDSLRLVLYEVVLLAWFVLILLSIDLNRLLSALPSNFGFTILLGSITGGLIAVSTWWEGDEQPNTHARLALCVVALASSYSLVIATIVATHDWLITRLLINSPISLTYVLPLIALGLIGFSFFLLLSASWVWQLSPLNVLAVALLRIYFTFDRRGYWHTSLRHLRHVLTCRFTFIPKLLAAIRFLWQLTVGPIPKYFAPLGDEKSRYRQFLEHRLEQQEAAIHWDDRIRWDNATESSAQEPYAIKHLRISTRRQAETFIALGDYLVCPRGTCQSVEVQPDELWQLAKRMDQLVLASRSLANHTDDNSYDRELLKEVRDHLVRYYTRIHGTQNKDLDEFIELRLKLLAEVLDGHLLSGRDLLLNWLKSKEEWHDFAVHSFLSEFRLAHDWSSVIEIGRILTLKGLYTLNESDHLETGNAYWHEARLLGDGTLGRWALEHSVSHFYSARAQNHLKTMPSPFR